MNTKLIAPLTLAALLAACASSAPSSTSSSAAPAPAPSTSARGDRVCNAAPIADMVGQSWAERAASSAQQRSGASVMRVMKPGQVMTMEYNPQRLTVVLDENNRVMSARCG